MKDIYDRLSHYLPFLCLFPIRLVFICGIREVGEWIGALALTLLIMCSVLRLSPQDTIRWIASVAEGLLHGGT